MNTRSHYFIKAKSPEQAHRIVAICNRRRTNYNNPKYIFGVFFVDVSEFADGMSVYATCGHSGMWDEADEEQDNIWTAFIEGIIASEEHLDFYSA